MPDETSWRPSVAGHDPQYDLSLEKPALSDVISGMGRPPSARGGSKLRPPSAGGSMSLPGQMPAGAGGGGDSVSAGQDRMNYGRELQEENVRLREKLADVQVTTRAEGHNINSLAKHIAELQKIVSSSVSVEVRAAVEERNADAIIQLVGLRYQLAERDKLVALERLEKERVRHQGEMEARRAAKAASSKPAAKAPTLKKAKSKKTRPTKKKADDPEPEEEEEEEEEEVGVPSPALVQAEEQFNQANANAINAHEKSKQDGKMAEAAVQLAADVRTVAQATAAKAKAAIESLTATAAAGALQERAILEKEAKTAKEDCKSYESSAAQLQGQLATLKREEEKLKTYIVQLEGESKADMAAKGQQVEGMTSQVQTLTKEKTELEEAIGRLKVAAEKKHAELQKQATAALEEAAAQLEAEKQNGVELKEKYERQIAQLQGEKEKVSAKVTEEVQAARAAMSSAATEAEQQVMEVKKSLQETEEQHTKRMQAKLDEAQSKHAAEIARLRDEASAAMGKLQEEADERVERMREEIEEHYRKEMKNLQNDLRAKRQESTSLVENELQAAELERETLERKAKEMLERAKKEKREIEKKAEEAIEKVLADRNALEEEMMAEKKMLLEEIRQMKQGKFADVEQVVAQAAMERQQALQELGAVQKQRQREAENATRQTKIALNTLRREKETLAEQVKHWMRKSEEMRETIAELKDKTNDNAFEQMEQMEKHIVIMQEQIGIITKSLGKLEVIMKPLTEKVNTLGADLEIVKRSQRSAEDLMIGGLEKLEKDLRDKVRTEMRKMDREMRQELIELRKAMPPPGSQACTIA